MPTKTAFIIQARMSSHRLPGKVLMPLPIGGKKEMLAHIVEGLHKVDVDKDIIVATSSLSHDNAIAEFCREHQISCFRGEPENVLSRYQYLAEKGGYETIVRYTGDNPFVDPQIIEKVIAYHHQENADLTFPTGLPLGIHAEVVQAKCLIALQSKELTSADKEHVTWYFKNRRDEYKVCVLDFAEEESVQNLRLTVDYPSDMGLASILWNIAKVGKYSTNLAFIKKIYESSPWVFQINQGNLQKMPPVDLKDEMQRAQGVLKDLDLLRAAHFVEHYAQKIDNIGS